MAEYAEPEMTANEGQEGPKMTGTTTEEELKEVKIDFANRDPLKINQGLAFSWPELFAEPHASVHSFDSVWLWAAKLFIIVKLWCYRICSLVCGIPASICWAIHFACLSFCTIWCWTPGLKSFIVQMNMYKICFDAVVGAFVAPCYAAIGMIFSNINVKVTRE